MYGEHIYMDGKVTVFKEMPIKKTKRSISKYFAQFNLK